MRGEGALQRRPARRTEIRRDGNPKSVYGIVCRGKKLGTAIVPEHRFYKTTASIPKALGRLQEFLAGEPLLIVGVEVAEANFGVAVDEEDGGNGK